METTIENVEQIAALTSTLLDIPFLRAALSCTAKDPARYYLEGVFVHQHEGAIRIAATDGHRLFVGSQRVTDSSLLPAWLQEGVIIPADGLKARLDLIAASDESDLARAAFSVGAPRLELSDPSDCTLFRIKPIAGNFPDYQAIVDRCGDNLEGGTERMPLDALAFNSKYLGAVGSMGKLLGAKSVNLMAAGSEAAPSVVTFEGVNGALLILMPMRLDERGPVAGETAMILSGALKGTLAALRAHKTRNEAAAEAAPEGSIERKDLLAKAAAFSLKIDAILRGTTPDLPAPAQEPDAPDTDEPAETPPADETPAAGDDEQAAAVEAVGPSYDLRGALGTDDECAAVPPIEPEAPAPVPAPAATSKGRKFKGGHKRGGVKLISHNVTPAPIGQQTV